MPAAHAYLHRFIKNASGPSTVTKLPGCAPSPKPGSSGHQPALLPASPSTSNLRPEWKPKREEPGHASPGTARARA